MILPDSYTTTLLLMILTMICWGSWANSLKLAGNWRFELFYYDYSIGLLVISVIAAFTFGSLGFDGFLFLDDLMRAGKRNMAYGFAAGVIFNLGNMLLVGAISVAGLAVAFPVGIGLALVIGVVTNYIINPQGNPTFLFAGVLFVIGAIILDALAYRSHGLAKSFEAIREGRTKSIIPKATLKGVFLSVAAGVFMGFFYPLVELGKRGDAGLGPYGIAVIFCVGVLTSTVVFNLYFMNLPIQGEPVEILDYFRGSWKVHLLGLAGGAVWCTGTIASFVAASAPEEVQVGPAISYAMGQGATMISALWGVLLWKEFKGADTRVMALLVLMFLLFTIGLGLISVAPLFAVR